MKDVILERILISAAPESKDINQAFIDEVMEKIRLETAAKERKAKKSGGLIWRIKHLHGVALAAFIIVAVLAFGAVAYAAIRFLPELLRIDRTQTNSRGETEYVVDDFTNCQNIDDAQIQEMTRFVQVPDAPPLSEEEATKILQARCEMTMIDSVVRSQWPARGPDKKENLHAVYYVPYEIGELVSLTDEKVDFSSDPASGQTRSLRAIPGQKIEAFSKTRKIPLSDLRKSDTVMLVVEMIESSADKVAPPRQTGVKGLVKMSLPIEYYRDKQLAINDSPSCIGNPSESCPSTPSIDIYPRKGGEGASNPYLSPQSGSWQTRYISGEVTALSANSLTLRSFSDKTYKVTLGENGIQEYNEIYSKPYTDNGTDAKVRVGSKVTVGYMQPEGASPLSIEPDQLMFIKLMLKPTTNPKTNGLNEQY